MDLPSPTSAPDAIRAIAAYLLESVRKARETSWRELLAATHTEIREHYEQAPADEFELPVELVRPFNASPDYPGGSYVAPGPEIPFFDMHGYDRIFYRPRRRARLLRQNCELLPSTWSASFYERVAWPTERLRDGEHPFRLFLDITRGRWTLTIFIHDVLDPWLEPSFKAIPPGEFPVPPNFPFSGYITVDARARRLTYCRWLTVYLAQRMYLTNDEERYAVEAFFASSSLKLRDARITAYERMKRRFVQPLAGRVSFSSYFWRSSDAVLRENSWREPAAFVDPASPFIDLKILRMTEPALHRAVLHRLNRGATKPVEVDGRTCVLHGEVDRIDQERIANAMVRAKNPYSVSQRSDWLRRLQTGGVTKSAARRKLARWINSRGLGAEQIELLLAGGAGRHRMGSQTGTG